MDTAAQWPQPMEQMTPNTCSRPMLERKIRPQKEQALNCPRCNSTNTKFCYYNNYSLTQPRYFCKTCRRYWTEGGSLRNVPVGGGSRKNKRSSILSSSSSSSTTAASSSSSKIPDLNPPSLSLFSPQNPRTHEGQDLNVAFPATQHYHAISQLFVEGPKMENSGNNNIQHNSPSTTPTSHSLPALELLRSTGIASRGLSSFIPVPMPPDLNTLYPSGFSFQDFKPTINFSVDGVGNRFGSVQENGGAGRGLFPFGEMKQVASTGGVDHQNNKGQGDSSGCNWNGVLGGRSW